MGSMLPYIAAPWILIMGIDNNFMNLFLRRRAHGGRNETATLEQLLPAMWDYRLPGLSSQGQTL